MNIEVIQQDSGINGNQEVWVKVQSNTLTDWPTAKRGLTSEQKLAMNGADLAPCGYYPDNRTPAERAESGYEFEDFYVFRVRSMA